MQVTTIGLDIAKHVFQVHGADAAGKPVLRQRLRRGQVLAFFGSLGHCTVGIEACATAHHWARGLRALGHEVRLVPPSYVKAYVKRNKNDAADAEAICEAVARPTMRFVPVKGREQQAVLMLHRARSLVIAQRRSLGNAVRATSPSSASSARRVAPGCGGWSSRPSIRVPPTCPTWPAR